ncbi:hypothetical protein FZEAL_9853 [Fusarium zealandicum]|uniref:Extracellular membrane protein CFEM domain-containing protein n=1 Tax=Fusarium zealandicum TaxID=1053134 RepID=A0A8H4XDS1_9HYPO|nr:hypothetical protein FZEAL_9853 [Fusarium zealandicum]
MKASVIFALLSAALVSAEASGCTESAIEKCLHATGKPEPCIDSDRCFCGVYKEIAACYVDCPNDSRGQEAEKKVDLYCQRLRRRKLKNSVTK